MNVETPGNGCSCRPLPWSSLADESLHQLEDLGQGRAMVHGRVRGVNTTGSEQDMIKQGKAKQGNDIRQYIVNGPRSRAARAGLERALNYSYRLHG